MALLAAPLSAPAEEPWLRACAAAGLDLHLLRDAGGDARGVERGLEQLVGAAEQRGCAWVALLGGDADSVAYAVSVLGAAGAVVVLRSAAEAMAALVDACSGGGPRVLLAQCDAGRASGVAAAFAAGDVAGGLGAARIAVLRDGPAGWAAVGLPPGGGALLWRVAVPGPSMRLPGAAAPSRGLARLPVSLRGAPEAASPARRPPPRVAAGLALLLIVAVSVGGAGWVITHRGGAPGAALGPISWNGAGVAAPSARVDPMAATWDRTAEVILFGGADPGSGHGTPLGDTWRGSLQPSPAWHAANGGASPPARLGGAAASDPAGGDVLLYGGEGFGDTGLADTWTYAGGWSQRQPQHAPPPGPALAATEPSTGRVLLTTACCALGAVPTGDRMQTWRWTGTDWSLLGAAPGWVTTAGLATDGWDGTVVMLASNGAGSGLTYVWDGAAWSARGGAAPPVPPGSRPQLTYDPRSRAVLDVVPAADGTHDTWAWNGGAWSRVETGGGPPVVGLVLGEPVDGHAVLYGGTAEADELTQRWFWAGTEWAETVRPPAVAAQPSALFGEAVAADPGSGGLVLSGGGAASGETWVWSGHDWTQAFFTAPGPLPRAGAAIAYDPVARRTLLLGGRLDDGTAVNDMWAWQGSAWVPVRATPLPPPSDGAVMAWDPLRGSAVLVLPDGGGVLPSAQTWTWDGAAWTKQAFPVEPPLHAGSSMAFDPTSGGMLLMVPCCRGSTTQRSETWRWDGATWHRLDPLHSPPLHASLATDAAHGRVVLVAACCAGFDGDTIGPPQTWTWDGTDWSRLGASLPALQDVGALATDASGSVLLVGRLAGAGPGHPLDGVWRWTGAAWVRLF